jgi:hypothetical protein
MLDLTRRNIIQIIPAAPGEFALYTQCSNGYGSSGLEPPLDLAIEPVIAWALCEEPYDEGDPKEGTCRIVRPLVHENGTGTLEPANYPTCYGSLGLFRVADATNERLLDALAMIRGFAAEAEIRRASKSSTPTPAGDTHYTASGGSPPKSASATPAVIS